MLPKTCFDGQTLKSYDGRTKSMYFLLKIMTYLKNVILFGIESVLI